MDCDEALAGLNPAQREAVRHGGGALLVLAGAGSGKTRVITHRIAQLVRVAGVAPARILAVTFTNKAAGEMRERVEALLGSRDAPWIGTFHALCLRILRRDGTRIGLGSGFVVYDRDDQIALVKRILHEQAAEESPGAPRTFLGRISRAKNALESPDALEARAYNPEARRTAQIYRAYQEALRRARAVDFDDILVRTLELFEADPALAQGYASRCEHLLVDEYQDTNRPQYLLIRRLTAVHGNVCVVGDEDQSIYRFRGADLRNILEFEHDHAQTTTIRLEQNYRSSGTIVAAAGALIAHNRKRKGKTLWTENARGEGLELLRAPDDRIEAAWVAQRARRLAADVPYEQMAVLYRTNAQSRQLEELFRRDSIPYQIVGSVQFYERKEIKDLLAYLKLAVNPADDVAFRRVLNTPARGIGDTTLAVIEGTAAATGLPLLEAAGQALGAGSLAGRAANALRAFLQLATALIARAESEPPADVMRSILERVEYEAYLRKSYGELAEDRLENVQALVSAAAEYAEESDSPTAAGFLDRSALVSDADEIGAQPGVTLMTIHCAKGLEFAVVFLVGLEERLFPHALSDGSEEDLEEERRLCYVAMTRARQRLLLSHAHLRRLQGALLPSRPSRFLDEIPAELLVERRAEDEGFFGSWTTLAERAAPGESSALRAARQAVPAAV
ncbi:MAG TPA: UvrD-helicase domain-containing protein, partial [Candidatus Polarisedimenticolaceae bacterium]|nr:UvrD-helicase domain-containing protein [Candidatus Polarisedimenticolaceae bacterium]